MRLRIQTWNPVMKRRTKAVLLISSLAVTTVVASYAMLSVALARAIDPQGYCNTGFSRLSSCTLRVASRTTTQSKPAFGPLAATWNEPDRVIASETTAWAVAQCPRNAIANRLLCAVPSATSPAEAASDDLATGLPRPKPWLISTAKQSSFITSVHVETPLSLTGVLAFYRAELTKRGWTETDAAAVEPDRAVIAYTTSDGPAQLRLVSHDGRTIADLSRRKPATDDASIVSMPGRARLMLGNATEEAAVMSINGRSVELAAGIGDNFRSVPATGDKSPAVPDMNLAPGRYCFSLKLASGASENRVFEVAANETWGLLAGPEGIIPLHLY